MCVLPCTLELKWSQDKSICEVFTLTCVCVDDVVRVGGGKVEKAVSN